MTERHVAGGRARAEHASRGRGGQFMSESQQEASANTQHQRDFGSPTPPPSSSRSSYKPKTVGLSLKSLDIGGEWWESLSAQYPNVNLHAELLKALDWHGAGRVKSPKLFFRNWIERASLSAPAIARTPEQIRASLRIVS